VQALPWTVQAVRRSAGDDRAHVGACRTAMQFVRVISRVEQMEIWNANRNGFSFVISYVSHSGPGLQGRTGFVASWRPIDQNRSAIRVGGSPFKTLAEAEEACEAMLGAAAQTSPSGLIDPDEFKDRQDCLYREAGRMIATHGTSTVALDDIAKAAVQLCSQAVRARLLQAASSSARGEELVRYDRIQTERRALAIGKELKEKAAAP
jgi:hypothetical protein